LGEGVSIRTATTADAGLIADISRESFYDAFAKDNTQADMDKFMSGKFSKELLMQEVGVEGNVFLLAYLQNEPAGYVFLKDNTEPSLHTDNALEISRLYSRNKFIGKGIGRALMLAAIAKAKELHKEIIWLGVWEHNQRAIQFYTSFGFKKFSEHDFVLGDDVQRDHLMKKDI
jgi:ribosomal protein S18 acetylase RimI-like enzyme